MSKALEFFVWIIIGGFFAAGYALYEMLYLSPRGRDKVSQCKKL